MKVRLLPLLLLCLALLSCEKVDLSEYLGTSEEGYTIVFNMDVFSQSDFESRAVKKISDIAEVINFAVFQNGEKLKTISQKRTDAGFGKISVNLPEGEYEIAAVAHSGSGNATFTSPAKIAFSNNKVTDTFSLYKTITVDGAKEFDVQLSRTVSMFRLKIEQEIPAEVTQLKFYYTGGSSTLDATTGFGCVNSRQTEYRDVTNHATGQVFEVYTFPHDTDDELNMTITALDAAGNTCQEKELPQVFVTLNKITTYYGNFFIDGSSNASSFTLYGDDEWDGEDEYQL